MVRGAHQIAFGGNYIHTQLNVVSYLNSSGNYTFNGQNTGLGLADFMIGRPSNFQQASPSTVYNRQHYIGAYLQDTWKANSRLTVNAGVRWEPFLPTYSKNSYISHFNAKLFSQGVRSTVYKNAPAGLMFPGDPGYPGKKMGFARLGHFAPRLGVVWDPKGDGRMTIRAAYGTFFDLPNMFFFYAISAQNPPFGNVIARPNPANGFLNPWEGYPGGNPFPLTVTRDATFPLAAGYNSIPLNHTSTYTNQWNLSVQRQVGDDWLVAANYVGNNVIHMWTGNQVNPSVYIPGASTTANANQRRVLYLQNPAQGQYYGAINQLDDGGTAVYHGMLLSVQRRRSRGMTVQGNYTLSHCIGDLPNVELGVQGPNYSMSNNRRADRGNCAQDRRHLFNLSTVVETPQFSGSVARTVLSGWQVSAIVRLQSGGFFSAATGLDNALTTGANQRANQLLADPYASDKTVDRWINPAAFQQPATGTIGNAGINALLGPGRMTIDAGLTRSFQIREGQTLQFRVEAFNLPNHLNPNNPVSALNNPNFGRILSAADPRLLQAALKFAF